MTSDEASLTRRDIARLSAGLAALSLPATATPAATGKRRQARIPAQDRLEVMELIALYAWAYDTSHPDDLVDTFTQDGTLTVFGRPIGGREEIRSFIAGAIANRGEAGWQHLTDQHVFRDYSGERCTVYSFYLMAEADRSGGNGRVRAMGYYVSHCRKEAGEWRFASREIVRWNSKRPW